MGTCNGLRAVTGIYIEIHDREYDRRVGRILPDGVCVAGRADVRYEVYADRLFFLHFGMNFLLLVMTARLGGYRSAYRRLAAAAALGSMVFLGIFLMPAKSGGAALVIKPVLFVAGSLGMLYVAFGRRSGRRHRKKSGMLCKKEADEKTAGTKRAVETKMAGRKAADALARGRKAAGPVMEALALYTASACVLGGALLGVGIYGGQKGGMAGGTQKGNSGLGLWLSAVCISVGGLWLLADMKRRRKNPFWEAELREGERCVRVTAFLDSGNSLYDPVSALPVCIVEREVAGQLSLFTKPEGFRLIPYHSIGKEHGLLYASVVEEMYLQKGGQRVKREKVLLAVSDRMLSGTGRYQMLLHPALLEETKGANHDIESSNAGKDAV